MKIYVDGELPKSCGECPFNYDSIGCEVFEPKTGEDGDELRRCLDSMYGNIVKDAITDRRFSKCPLETTQSLKQQMREEVVEEIRQLCEKEKDENDLAWLGFKKLNRILEQVKGKSNVQD